jgi:hypothetical protein
MSIWPSHIHFIERTLPGIFSNGPAGHVRLLPPISRAHLRC